LKKLYNKKKENSKGKNVMRMMRIGDANLRMKCESKDMRIEIEINRDKWRFIEINRDKWRLEDYRD